MIPVRWSAPESLRQGIFSTKSDVFAFGATCFEIFSFGAVPYPRMPNNEVFDAVLAGKRMGLPTNTPKIVYSLMLRCWAPEPHQRVSFRAIEAECSRIVHLLGTPPETSEQAALIEAQPYDQDYSEAFEVFPYSTLIEKYPSEFWGGVVCV